MSALVPCLACRRHIRSHETRCCFCGAERTPLAEPVRQVALPRGVKRATLFALSVTLAGQACAEPSAIAIYGAPAPPGAGAANGAGGTRSVDGSGGSGAGGNGAGNGTAGDSNVQPVYGAVVPPQAGGSSGSVGLPEEAPWTR